MLKSANGCQFITENSKDWNSVARFVVLLIYTLFFFLLVGLSIIALGYLAGKAYFSIKRANLDIWGTKARESLEASKSLLYSLSIPLNLCLRSWS